MTILEDIKIHDADRHVIEPMDLWTESLGQAFINKVGLNLRFDTVANRLDRTERLGSWADIRLSPQLMLKGKPALKKWNENMQIHAAYKREEKFAEADNQMSLGMDPIKQVQSMGKEVHTASMFPTFAGFIVNNHNLTDDESLQFCNAYNHWLNDYCKNHDRLYGVGLVSRHNPSNLVSQVEQIKRFGWKTIVLRPEVINGKDLGDPEYNAFWDICESSNISIAFHGGTHLQAPTAGSDRFSSHFAMHACAHPMEMQQAFLSLLESGVLHRHPNLKFAFLEAGAGWVPSWLWRLDEICKDDLPNELAHNIAMPPSEYFKRQCWVGVELGEPCLQEVIKMIGSDKLLYGTDFPHPDHLKFDINEFNEKNTGLSSNIIAQVLSGNGLEFFNIGQKK
ncbi:amidohydrolase family protein [Pseudoalteromonas luteoviolacea]|uniref:Amidohydrolase-related domain-containing protein n=1 Tax=Pseudoalteromonas luteoviolacea S4060-1 TaxID=1365257 RepID=A0A162BG72_9GAMM|nr:amidohydrolase family protein [Pseudoalteromonas luteoviolacea]KZN61577.1 hypothetical protein N478_05785 [Pseudoalteromonas luteoviolacea S4060-1]